jgi:hypothetical protein
MAGKIGILTPEHIRIEKQRREHIMGPTFKELWEQANQIQRDNYNDLMESISDCDTLNEYEKKKILWLAGWDWPTVQGFKDIFEKLVNWR